MQLFALGMHLYTEFDKSEEDYVCREKIVCQHGSHAVFDVFVRFSQGFCSVGWS